MGSGNSNKFRRIYQDWCTATAVSKPFSDRAPTFWPRCRGVGSAPGNIGADTLAATKGFVRRVHDARTSALTVSTDSEGTTMTATTDTVGDDVRTLIIGLLGPHGLPLGTVLRELAAYGLSRSAADTTVRTLANRGTIQLTDDRRVQLPLVTDGCPEAP